MIICKSLVNKKGKRRAKLELLSRETYQHPVGTNFHQIDECPINCKTDCLWFEYNLNPIHIFQMTSRSSTEKLRDTKVRSSNPTFLASRSERAELRAGSDTSRRPKPNQNSIISLTMAEL